MIRIDFTDYCNSYGQKPSGFGDWLFKVGDHQLLFQGLFSDALQQAKLYARRIDIRKIKVLDSAFITKPFIPENVA